MIKFEIDKIQKAIMVNGDRNNTTKNAKGRGTTLSPIEYRSKPNSRKVLNNSIANDMNIQEAYGNMSIGNSKSAQILDPISVKSVRK